MSRSDRRAATTWAVRAATLALGSSLATAASAGSHLWRYAEIYSSPDRSIQFIEMREIAGSANENLIRDHWYQTNTYNLDQSELLGSDLVGNTANKRFLVGTVSYAALPGVPAPDYVLPDGFLNPDGDTVVWWFYQTITIPPATMPSDGLRSLIVIGNTNDPSFGVAINSPTNFAGETGIVLLPGGVPVLGGPLGTGLLALCVVGMAGLALWRAHRA